MLMSTTMKLIGKTTLSSNAADIEFTNIPGTYTDLVVQGSLRGNAVASGFHGMVLQFNSNTTGYSSRELRGNGSAAGSEARTVVQNGVYIGNAPGAGSTSNTFSTLEIYIPNYAGSTNKSLSVTHHNESNAAAVEYAFVLAGLWSNTAAITSLKVSAFTGHGTSIVTGSSVYLYGITKA